MWHPAHRITKVISFPLQAMPIVTRAEASMKGSIVKCMEEMVTESFGARKWVECMDRAGIPAARRHFTVLSDVNDADVHAIMKGISGATSLSIDQVMDAFGEHWSTVFGPRVYSAYFSSAKNARELLLNLDHIHDVMTKSIKFAHPPRFTYEWKGEKCLIMHYNSTRGMVALMPGLIRGVGKYFNEKLTVQVEGNSVYVEFQ
jgi:hypothetical protein